MSDTTYPFWFTPKLQTDVALARSFVRSHSRESTMRQLRALTDGRVIIELSFNADYSDRSYCVRLNSDPMAWSAPSTVWQHTAANIVSARLISHRVVHLLNAAGGVTTGAPKHVPDYRCAALSTWEWPQKPLPLQPQEFEIIDILDELDTSWKRIHPHTSKIEDLFAFTDFERVPEIAAARCLHVDLAPLATICDTAVHELAALCERDHTLAQILRRAGLPMTDAANWIFPRNTPENMRDANVDQLLNVRHS